MLFPLGKVVATPGALQVLAATGQSPVALLHRHANGDWGDLDEEDNPTASFTIFSTAWLCMNPILSPHCPSDGPSSR